MPKITDPLCPVCKSTSCYHCWECQSDLGTEDHHLFCSHYHNTRCVACGGSGYNSKDGQCFPCGGSGIQSAAKEKV